MSRWARAALCSRGDGDDDAGMSVSAAGDVNDDGMDDVIVGAPAGGPGRAYVVFGKGGTQAVQLSDVAGGMGGFVLEGESAGDQAGRAVSGAGDINGDGLADVIVGADRAGPNGGASGRSYVVYGKDGYGRRAAQCRRRRHRRLRPRRGSGGRSVGPCRERSGRCQWRRARRSRDRRVPGRPQRRRRRRPQLRPFSVCQPRTRSSCPEKPGFQGSPTRPGRGASTTAGAARSATPRWWLPTSSDGALPSRENTAWALSARVSASSRRASSATHRARARPNSARACRLLD